MACAGCSRWRAGGRRAMVLIDNDVVKRVLTMRECIKN
jgi:hypothetical protein